MTRREFVRISAAAAAGVAVTALAAPSEKLPVPTAQKLPRWRGFNLTEKCVKSPKGNNTRYRKSDFEWIEGWGFNFARLPLSYLCWTDADDWMTVKREDDLRDLDEAVALGEKHQIHINLNLHRAPGYCVNPPKEAKDLWTDASALEACTFHWAMLAKRYKGIPNERLSFDLLNEPAHVAEADYAKVVQALVQAIRAEDSKRLIAADGLRWARDPVFSLKNLRIAQSTRGYDPMPVTHYKANWVQGADTWPEPQWPLKKDGKVLDKAFLQKDRIEPWKKLQADGVGVHVGEWGVFNKTPHPVALAWMRDVLDLWKSAGWGWALWNFRGGFGVLDSGRADVAYEDFHGTKLDREMLKVLQAG